MGSNTYEIKVGVSTSGESDVGKLGSEMEKLGRISSFKTLRDQIAAANQKVIDAQVKVDALAVKMENARKPSQRLTTQYVNATANLEKMTAAQTESVAAFKNAGVALEGMGVDIKNLDREQEQLTGSTKRLKEVIAARGLLGVRPYRDIKDDVEKLTAAYKRLEVEHKNGTISTKELYKAEMQLREKTQELEESSNGWARSMGGVKNGLLALAAAGYGAVQAFASYGEFAQQMAKVNTMIDVTKEKHKELSDTIVDISKRVPESATGLAEAEYDVLSSGVALEQSTAVLEKAARAAVAGVTDTKTAAATGIGVVNAYGMEIGELSRVYDVMFQTIKDGVVDFPQLAQSMGDILPTARAAGIGFEDVSASIATLTKNGMQAPKAFTALKGAIVALASPAPEAKKKFDELGITWKGLIPTLEEIRKKNLDISRMRELIPDVEARSGVLSLTQSMGQLTTSLEGMNNAAGQTDIAYDKMKDTPLNQTAMLRNEFSALAMVLEEDLMKVIMPLMKGLKAVAGAVGETDKETKFLIEAVVVSTAGLVAWRAGLATVAFGLKGLGIELRTLTSGMAIADLRTKGLAASFTSLGAAQKAAFAASAIGAAYGVVEIGKLVYEVVQWSKALADAEDSMNRLKKNAQDLVDRNLDNMNVKVPSVLSGKSKDELKDMDKQVRGAIAGYTGLMNILYAKSEETDFFGNATDGALYAQKRLVEVGKTLKALKEDYKRLREAQGLTTKTVKPVTSETQTSGGSTSDVVKKDNEDRKRLAGQLENELIKISGDGFKVREEQARKHYADQVAMAHGSKDLIAKAAKVRDAVLSKIDKERREADQKAALESDRARLDRLESDSDFALAMLEDTYDDGLISLKDYFAERRRILEEQYQAEYDLLMKQAIAETDPERKRSLENQIHDLGNRNAQENRNLDRDQTRSETDMKDKRDSIMAGLRESGRGYSDQDELDALDERHQEQLNRLIDFEAKKEEIIEAQRLQRAERDELEDKQERKRLENRLGYTAEFAGNIATTFENLYELTGRKHKEFLVIQKAAAISEAMVNTYLGATKAYSAMAGIYAVGPALGTVAAAAAIAAGLANVAVISSQQYATGGPVGGSSPHDKADNISAWLTAGEFVQPVSAVRYYGPGVMEALRRKMVPREMFSHMYDNINALSSRVHFAEGGYAQNDRSPAQGGGASAQVVQITNIIDPRLFEQYAASSEGQKTIMNVISKNSFQVKRILSR